MITKTVNTSGPLEKCGIEDLKPYIVVLKTFTPALFDIEVICSFYTATVTRVLFYHATAF